MILSYNYCPKGLLCRGVPKIAVCLSVRASVRPSVRCSFVRTFFDHLLSTENGAIKGIWSKRKIKTGPKCQKCNALDLRSEGKWLSFGMAYGTSSINALLATLPCRSNLVVESLKSVVLNFWQDKSTLGRSPEPIVCGSGTFDYVKFRQHKRVDSDWVPNHWG